MSAFQNIGITVTGQFWTAARSAPSILSGCVSVFTITSIFDAAWDGLTIDAIFENSMEHQKHYVRLVNGVAIVPQKVLQTKGAVMLKFAGYELDEMREEATNIAKLTSNKLPLIYVNAKS